MPTIEQDTAALTQLLAAFFQQPAGLEFNDGQKAAIRALVREKDVALLAFPLKCGGTFLREAVGAALGLRLGRQTSVGLLRGSFMGAGDGERDLYLPNLLGHLLDPSDDPTVLHSHAKATGGTRCVMDLFGLRACVMKRNILDMLRSYHESIQKSGAKATPRLLLGYDDGFFDLPIETQKDLLVSNFGPWYVSFYASWILAERRGEIAPVQWVSFDDFREDPVSTTEKILSFFSLDTDRTLVEAAVQHADRNRNKLRFNKGVSGRGKSFFSERHQEQLEQLTLRYPAIDFGAEGLV